MLFLPIEKNIHYSKKRKLIDLKLNHFPVIYSFMINRICVHKQKMDTKQLKLAVLLSYWQPNGEQSNIKSGLGVATVEKHPNKV